MLLNFLLIRFVGRRHLFVLGLKGLKLLCKLGQRFLLLHELLVFVLQLLSKFSDLVIQPCHLLFLCILKFGLLLLQSFFDLFVYVCLRKGGSILGLALELLDFRGELFIGQFQTGYFIPQLFYLLAVIFSQFLRGLDLLDYFLIDPINKLLRHGLE